MRKLLNSFFLILALLLAFGPAAQHVDAATMHGLQWNVQNAAANSDVRLRWTGANLPPRWPLTILYKYKPIQQNDYYAIFWYSDADETFDGSNDYQGATPFPPGGSGAVHNWEIAAKGTDTYSTQVVVAGQFRSQAFTSATDISSNLNLRYLWAVDSSTTSTHYVDFQYTAADLASCGCTATAIVSQGHTYIMELGASPWRSAFNGDGTANDETLSGVIRYIQIYDTLLSASDIVSELASNSNNAVTAVGGRHLWYSNIDPVPSDVTDKSGAGHNPAWANALRPIQWDSTFGSTNSSRMSLTGAGGH